MRKLHHVCIQTNVYDESLNFYTNILGFKLIKETKNFHNRKYNTWLEQDGFMIELQTGKEDKKLTPDNDEAAGIAHMCFLVEDVKEEVKRIQQLGYNHFKLKHNSEIYEVEGSALSKIIAPEGTIVEIRQTQQI